MLKLVRYSSLIFILLFSFNFGTEAKPVDGDVPESADSPDIQWASVPEMDEGSMMAMLNSMIDVIRARLSGWMYGSVSNDEVEVEQNGGFMSMIHGMFSRLTNIAMDMMGQMRRMRDKSTKDKLTESSSTVEEDISASVNSSTLATRLKNQMDQTKERIKDAWNNLVKKYQNATSSKMTRLSPVAPSEDYHLIDDEAKANMNLQSDNKRVIRSVNNADDNIGQSQDLDSESKSAVLARLITMDEWLRKRSGKGKSKQLESLIARPDETDDRKPNIFDRMKGAMDNARSKFFGAIGKFMNGSMINTDSDDDSTNMTEDDPKNWWSMLMPKEGSKRPDREPLNPRNLFPTKTTHPFNIPKTNNENDLIPMIPSSRPIDVDWSVKSVERDERTDKVDNVEQSRTTIEFMDKFKSEMEMFKSSMDGPNDNLEMAMEKLASWGLFVRGLTESKNLDDFWGKLTQQN
ncbi:uncharacterized protein LOC107359911 [Tetranychus urticae]|uniref:Uncharacterized protein n=1 Tax=Tetranychus urticae TaxID=32264 RepID=T1K359_TETUR|nr:uncharacterized protein LOC107359911 [Tetranychus urticae]XP_025016118.1 uncharacterized protein LOC107359911 [Tetranychus urticae]